MSIKSKKKRRAGRTEWDRGRAVNRCLSDWLSFRSNFQPWTMAIVQLHERRHKVKGIWFIDLFEAASVSDQSRISYGGLCEGVIAHMYLPPRAIIHWLLISSWVARQNRFHQFWIPWWPHSTQQSNLADLHVQTWLNVSKTNWWQKRGSALGRLRANYGSEYVPKKWREPIRKVKPETTYWGRLICSWPCQNTDRAAACFWLSKMCQT